MLVTALSVRSEHWFFYRQADQDSLRVAASGLLRRGLAAALIGWLRHGPILTHLICVGPGTCHLAASTLVTTRRMTLDDLLDLDRE